MPQMTEQGGKRRDARGGCPLGRITGEPEHLAADGLVSHEVDPALAKARHDRRQPGRKRRQLRA